MKLEDFQNIQEVSYKQWKQKIQFELNGLDFNSLLNNTLEGIQIPPIFHLENSKKLNFKHVPTKPTNLFKEEYIYNQNSHLKNITQSKENGFNHFIFYSNKKFNLDSIAETIPDQANIQFDLNFLDTPFYLNLLDKFSPENCYLNIDIVGQFAKTGNHFKSLKSDLINLKQINTDSTAYATIIIDGTIYQNAGANCVQQIAYSITHALETICLLDGDIKNVINFKIAFGNDFQMDIAKIKALRYLWNVISKDYGIDKPIEITAFPSKRNKQIISHEVNELVLHKEYTSAVMAQCENIIIQGRNDLFKKKNLNDDLKSKEILDTLLEYNHPIDSNDFNYQIEFLSIQIAERALKIIQDIEKGGGFINQLRKGNIQRKIKENRDQEQIAFNKAKTIDLSSNIDSKIVEINPFINRKNTETVIKNISTVRLTEKIEAKLLHHGS